MTLLWDASPLSSVRP